MGLFIGDAQPSKIFVGDTPISKVFVGDTQVRPTGWQPGANTLAYYPLEMDTNDYSGNNRNLTNSGITFADGVGVFNGNAIGYYTNNSLWNSLSNFTYSVYINPSSITSGTYGGMANINKIISIIQNGVITTYDKSLSLCNSSQVQGYNYYNGRLEVYATGISINTWCYLTYTFDGNVIKIYKNGVLGQSLACGGSYTGYTQATLCVGNNTGNSQIKKYYGKISNVIIEDRTRTAQEILDYYNATKNNYPTTLNSLQNINLTPTNEINITPNNNGSGNVQSI